MLWAKFVGLTELAGVGLANMHGCYVGCGLAQALGPFAVG
jgi:hypothetical protein